MSQDFNSIHLEAFQDLEISFARVQEARDEGHGDDEREFMRDVVNELNEMLHGKDTTARLDLVGQFCRYLDTEADYIERELVDEMLAQVGIRRQDLEARAIDQATPSAPGLDKRPRL